MNFQRKQILPSETSEIWKLKLKKKLQIKNRTAQHFEPNDSSSTPELAFYKSPKNIEAKSPKAFPRDNIIRGAPPNQHGEINKDFQKRTFNPTGSYSINDHSSIDSLRVNDLNKLRDFGIPHTSHHGSSKYQRVRDKHHHDLAEMVNQISSQGQISPRLADSHHEGVKPNPIWTKAMRPSRH
ncbi:hypothetical protein O181_086274 [Austropuccinia psidii MF-1]|uniref:Uncharacterized protein n=1 Tax=Austropuccinia psidii MF-1 TaxID=1389203 RepID=A0A9Q3FWT5_9BASI|nr:hypothetical protein [Austropuccinia psidii MF-1]